MRKNLSPEISNRRAENSKGSDFSFSKNNMSTGVLSSSKFVEAKKKAAEAEEQKRAAFAIEFPEADAHMKSAMIAVETTALSSGASFDPSTPELTTSWSSNAPTICCINTYPNGITFSVHKCDSSQNLEKSNFEAKAIKGSNAAGVVAQESSLSDQSDEISTMGGGERGGKKKYTSQQFHLRFRDTRDYMIPEGRYFLFRERYLQSLEAHLAQLHQQGVLNEAVVYFGTVTDPFLNLQKKFDVTMSCLQLLERYTPARVVCQTRSPMVISALPTLKYLGSRSVVAMPVETILERSVVRYTPGMPRIAERLVAADGLRKQGICVNLVASPVLPYGDYERDAWDFADLLLRHSDYVTFGSIATGDESEERILRSMPVVQKLASDKEYLWLRPHSYRAVYQAAKTLAPDKLFLPVQSVAKRGQLSLFAA